MPKLTPQEILRREHPKAQTTQQFARRMGMTLRNTAQRLAVSSDIEQVQGQRFPRVGPNVPWRLKVQREAAE